MSYDSKLAQTGRRVANARRKYYGSFDYGSGIDARLRGGTFSFSRKHAWGGPDGKTWIPEIDETEVDEPDVQAMIAKYFRKHPNDAWKFGKDPETGLDYGAGFEGMSSGGTNWRGLATLGLGMIGSGIQSYNSMEDKSKALNQKYDVFGTNEFTGLTDNNALLSTMANTPMLSGATAKDFRDKTVGQDIMSALSTGVSATINSGGNYWVGLGAAALDAGKSVWERFDAKNRAKEASLEAKRKNHQFLKDMSMASQDVDARNDWMRMLGYYNDPYFAAFGGPLHSNGGDYSGGLTYINEGGRHEENPYEGVPSGFDEEGNPNLVEEGEVIWNNEYVFSDRLKVPKELATKYKLGGKKDYTFAEAIEKLTKENTISPNDFITIATTKEIVNEFMDAQEAIREENQLAAREELGAAQAQDFLAQLDAAQGMAPSMDAPIDLGQMSALPNEAPVTEGEMTPPGYAFGGNKFDGGGYKVVKVGNRYFITTEGAPKITGKMYGNRLVIDDQFKNLPSFNSLEKANREAERMRREALPALEYQSDIEASGVTAHTGDKIIKRDTGEVDTNLKPIYEYVVADPNTGETYRYHSYEAAAKKYSSIPRKVNDPRVKGGYAYVTPYGDVHINEKDAKDSLNKRMHPQSTSKSTVKTSQSKGIGTTAMAAEPPARNVEAVAPTVERPAVEAAGSTSTAPASSASQPTSGSGSVGRITTPSGNTINYRRDINGKEWESVEPYQNFLSYMRGKGKDSSEAKEWMDYIQNEIKNSGSRYELKDFDDWSRLAEDGKVGPVHQATLKAAEYFARRQGLTAVNPTGGPNLTIAEVLGVKPESIAGTPQNPVSGSPQTPSGSGTTQEPRFNYRDTRLRYAPVVGSAMATLYGMLNRPDYSNADRIIEAAYRMGTPINIPVETIGDYRRRNPFDERYLVNMANQNRAAAARGIANTAGGNRAMDLLGNMSLVHSNQQELGEIMRQAYLANRQDDAQVAEFNRGTNLYNMNAINQRNLSQAQLNTHRQQAGLSGLTQGYGLRQSIKDNWDSATMESLNSMLTSLGAIGKENEEYNILTSMAEQGYFPHYYRDRGIIDFVRPTKNGGKLNRKKRRF